MEREEYGRFILTSTVRIIGNGRLRKTGTSLSTEAIQFSDEVEVHHMLSIIMNADPSSILKLQNSAILISDHCKTREERDC